MENIACLLGLFCLILVRVCTALDCKEQAYDFNGKRCCNKCPPGQGLSQDCSHGNDTQCGSCVQGQTFSPEFWHTEKCQNCSECKKDSHVKTPCTIVEDTICECNVDFYFHTVAKECSLCNFCPIGYGAIIPCNRLQNSICLKCPNGTYSDVKSATLPCKRCTKCSSGQAEFKPCSDTENTICYGHPKENYTLQPTTAKDKKDFDVIPVYCAVLGAVVLGLLVYVIFKQYTRLKNRKIHKGHEPHEEVEYSKASGCDSGVYVENEFCKQYNQLSRVRDLPVKKKKELEKNLSMHTSDGNTWKQLAKELGYQEKKIGEFESSSSEVVSHVHNLLNHWSKYKHSTVEVLIKALTIINRLDIVLILQRDITERKSHLHNVI
ncbi:nerve growth factor receptor (TNFR superfamily member 16) [Mytilus galloprovincialis]|uniref:Nerve growth factor receptor (TNFR superfamily member 16) n=1 Tax=Mytilus galloprovincialis TaxID=29158 RepID=A0A8B6FJH5_MYTGA|nr:nerve growth factor receptor (TNFR superfamily member 16) [Mytilus galloprovincialis]